MVRSGKAMDRVRRGVDDALIFASLMALAWPLVFERLTEENASVVGWILPIAGVVLVGAAVARLADAWPLVQYAPVAAAVITAAVQHGRLGGADPELTWLIIIVAGIILVRQFLGSHTNEGLMRDLTRQRAILARQAFRDPLTQLGNRAMFMDHATDALADDDQTMTAVVLFDLDGFKGVNDTYGHAAGDELLKVTAERLNANVRANDTVSRLGGDEFVVLLPRLVDDAIADTVAGRILRDLEQPLEIGEVVLTIRASAGIAITKGGEHDVDTLLREADEALYQAKEDGKGVVRRFDPARFAEMEQRRRDEADLRRAFLEGQFEVFYQPIVDLDGEHTVGVEALVRWQHPNRGLLPPGAFLELAETIGMMPKLGLWILREACLRAVEWQRQNPGFELNVNLSASQLANPELTDEIRAVIEETGIPSELLVLELTETVALTDLKESARILASLKTLGVRIALDDFGTGFSSLSHLGALPVDVVKIDKSFVQAMHESSVGGSVAEAVLQIARTFNLAPVAEGVEDREQADRLRELDCVHAQGYHFARPMPAAELTGLLTKQSALQRG
ncbi:putative bifunctional diguanylate cyclase/phosphodiesterase [Paractinoplanes atraurantiacus]|uniref:Diguanylate cyclase (GGDEF) domain-containing protein n=1 Tax=Paractinoplanes atraurantiacus TaxID=1036182 RepID=A0A285H0M0_9ACTN|nr:EAL domain-containing protein [Actinoplanes atraurantiacus]SNY29295.1 diguanylate cyclase (GGDEF) domain-containing protein [Actinoplanes atraurantiacus]